jgi:hypothetical protein
MFLRQYYFTIAPSSTFFQNNKKKTIWQISDIVVLFYLWGSLEIRALLGYLVLQRLIKNIGLKQTRLSFLTLAI